MTALLRARSFPACVHGFTTRHGGVSVGRFATLNLGERWGDDLQHVAENLRRTAALGGFLPAQLRRVRQVHGATIVRAVDIDAGCEADAIWHHRDHGAPELVLGVMTADCVPLLLVDEEVTAIAAVHSGWRGTVAGIAALAVERLASAGVARERLRAAIGPCIEVGAFEVGEEVAEQFDPRFVERDLGPRPHVDLVEVVRAQLEAAGVPARAIERVGGCTHERSRDYFSFRRDGSGIGQQLSFIGLAAAREQL